MRKKKLLMFDKKQSSLRLRSELNDLKRTSQSVAKELNCKESEIKKYLSGKYNVDSYLNFLIKFCDLYPVNMSTLIIYKKDTTNGILFFKLADSMKSSRIFKRKDKNNKLRPYYEYRDTAKSNLSNFYPEWISQIRYVENSKPNNPNVVFNKGHFLHQLNLFVGPVNYYYEINGKKICKEMNTGDTSYISPYVKHSFTTRDKTKPTYIVAVTTGSSLKRNQNELRMYDKNFFKNLLNSKNNKFQYFHNTIKRALKNEISNLTKFKQKIGVKLFEKLKNRNKFYTLSLAEIFKISEILKTSPSSFFNNIESEKEVIDKSFNETKFNYFPSNNNKLYKIYTSARTKNFTNLKGFIIEVISNQKKKFHFKFTLNIYLINFGETILNIDWKYNSKLYKKSIKPGDSIFIEPYINFNLSSASKKGFVFLVTSESSLDLNTEKEISSILNPARIIIDNQSWFEGK